MNSNFESRIKGAKEKEAYISYELYRIFCNVVNKGLTYQGSKCQFKELIPEYRINEDRADLVVFTSKYGRHLEPFLVIEVKVRAYDRPGPSVASAVSKARSYASGLGTTMPFFAVYDGWELIVFRNISPYLIGVFASVKGEHQAENFLLGLEEFYQSNKKDLLNKLPKHVDPDYMFKRILPSIAKKLAKDKSEADALLRSWRQML